jgi:hypothetical protein
MPYATFKQQFAGTVSNVTDANLAAKLGDVRACVSFLDLHFHAFFGSRPRSHMAAGVS